MKITAANVQEMNDYILSLPIGMETLNEILPTPITLKEITNIYLINSIERIILVSSTMIRSSKVFGTEENRLMNKLISEYPGYTFKVVNR